MGFGATNTKSFTVLYISIKILQELIHVHVFAHKRLLPFTDAFELQVLHTSISKCWFTKQQMCIFGNIDIA